MIFQILGAVEDCDQEIFEHRKVVGVEQTNDFDEREQQCLKTAVYHFTFVFFHVMGELVSGRLFGGRLV